MMSIKRSNLKFIQTLCLIFLLALLISPVNAEKEQETPRPKILSIELKVLYPGEKEPRTIEVDPEGTSAIFWSDNTVNEILAPYYKENPKSVTQKWILENYGERIGTKLIKMFGHTGEGDTLLITDEFVKTVWQLRELGFIYAGILKHPPCLITGL